MLRAGYIGKAAAAQPAWARRSRAPRESSGSVLGPSIAYLGVHDAEFHATVLGPGSVRGSLYERKRLPMPLNREDLRGQPRRHKVVPNRLGTTFGELLVVLVGSDVVGVAVHRDRVVV